MNLYLDARALQKPHWRGEQFYVHRLLSEMVQLGAEHTFHLHFAWEGWDPRIDALLAEPNVVGHEHRGRIRSHASLPLAVLRTRSRVYFRMYNEDAPLRVPIPARRVALVLDNGRHLFPAEYGGVDAAELLRATRRHISAFQLIVTISETVKREIVELLDVDPDRIVVASCAVDRPDREAPAERPPAVPAGADFLLMVNPGGANKNWQDALAGFARFARSQNASDSTLLVLAGSLSSEHERISHAIAADPVLAARVVCPGYVSESQMHWLYRHARLALCPSRYEGFGIPVLEAFAYGVPLIAADIPVLREVAGTGAQFVALGDPEAMADAIHRVLSDGQLRARLVGHGHARVDAYSWRDSATTALEALAGLAPLDS